MHNLVYGKFDSKGNFIIIPMAVYGAGPVSNEWYIVGLDDFLENSKFCEHGKRDLFNHIPIFKQNNTIFCSKCYEKIECKEGECFVLLENNKVRDLYPYSYEYSNVDFNLSCEIFNENSFKLTICIENLKKSPLSDLNITLFSFDSSLDLDEEDISWMFENPVNEANLIIYEEYNISHIKPKNRFEKEIFIRIPKKNEIKTFDLALKNNLLDADTLKFNNYFDIDEIKNLSVDFPLNIYILISFKNHYGVYQYYEKKIILSNDV